MTIEEFRDLQDRDQWPAEQRLWWAGLLPVCDAETFRREMLRADGMIEVTVDEMIDVTLTAKGLRHVHQGRRNEALRRSE